MYSEERWKEIADLTDGMALDGVWHYVIRDFKALPEARLAFLWIIGKLLQEERIKLAKHGVFLEGSPERLVQLFRETLPTAEEDVASIGGIENWFFAEECPGGAVWMREDGTEEWT